MLSLSCSSLQPLIKSLDRSVELSIGDQIALVGVAERSLTERQPHVDIAMEGERPGLVRALISGWAYRYKDLPDGRRQILGFLLPGDFFGLNADLQQKMDHSVCALTPVRMIEIFPQQLRSIAEDHPRLRKALNSQRMANSAILREWLLNIGQRSAIERLAHLLLELYYRSEAMGLTSCHGLDFPVTQCHLAEATGLTPVHVNRTIQELRRKGLISCGNGRLEIREFGLLKEIAMFDDSYLRMDEIQ